MLLLVRGGVRLAVRSGVLRVVLPHHLLARLVLVVLAVKGGLLLRGRIPIAGVPTLVGRDRRRGRDVGAVHVVPAAVLLRPGRAPVLVPSGRRVRGPAVEV